MRGNGLLPGSHNFVRLGYGLLIGTLQQQGDTVLTLALQRPTGGAATTAERKVLRCGRCTPERERWL